MSQLMKRLRLLSKIDWLPTRTDFCKRLYVSAREQKHMPRLKELGVKRWHRYVDDIFATLNNKHEALKLLEFKYIQQPN